jgi:Bifunctional DNA primase/polymerase, N-terminal
MTDALTSAYQYTEKRHWRLVAVKNGTKRPPADGWQNLRLEASDLPRYFSNGASIGVLCGEPSGNLVDVDLDCREAVALASHFLPKTALRHGRPGNPDSHLWYTCKPLPDTTKFRDPERPKEYGMIVEFRSTGTQTVVPPSLHPDGEAYLWHADGRPTEIDGRALLNAVSALAAAALLARYWPGSGSRQDAALALAGGLLRAEWEEDAVSHFVQAVATAAGDEEARKRATAGGFTSKRLTAEKRATGWPTLAELVGDKVADKVAEWLGISWEAGDIPLSFGTPAERAADVDEWPADAAPEAFHGLPGRVVQTVLPHTEADEHALLVSLLVGFGNAVGTSPHFKVGQTMHRLVLNVAIVGDTAEGRKGTSWDEIKAVYARADPEWYNLCRTSGLSSGEGIIHEVRDPVIKQEPIRENKRVVGYESVMVDEGVVDKRRLFYESEYARCLRVMGRDGNTLSTVGRQAWDGERLRTATKNSPETATGAHVSILTHTNPEDLRRYLDSSEAATGGGNRYIWMVARRSKFLPDGGNVPEQQIAALSDELAAALVFGRSVGEMRRTAEARDIWHAVYPELTKGRPGLAGALLARAAPQVVRLSCIFALMNLSATVRPEHLLAALALWKRADASVRYIFGDAVGDPVVDSILRTLRTQGPLDRNTIRDLFGRHVRAGRLDAALGKLASSGLVAGEKLETGGRPATVWKAV